VGAQRAGSQRLLARVARRQVGVFTLSQALDCGYTRSFVRRRIVDHAWQELEPRTYRVTLSAPPSWDQQLVALVLTTGGVASGSSAAALYGLMPKRGLQVALPRGRRTRSHRRPEVIALRDLAASDTTCTAGIPCLAPPRMLIELAPTLPGDRFADLLDTAIVRRIVTPRRIAERATELWAPGRPGCAIVLHLLEEAHPELWRARNEWEARVLRLFRKAKTPDPIPNYEVRVGGQNRFIDLAWPEHLVAVEFDGFVPHSTRRVFDDDRVRQNDLVDAQWKVFRLTSTAVRRRPAAAIAPVLRALGSTGSEMCR
jgi:hypothetical protein